MGEKEEDDMCGGEDRCQRMPIIRETKEEGYGDRVGSRRKGKKRRKIRDWALESRGSPTIL